MNTLNIKLEKRWIVEKRDKFYTNNPKWILSSLFSTSPR